MRRNAVNWLWLVRMHCGGVDPASGSIDRLIDRLINGLLNFLLNRWVEV